MVGGKGNDTYYVGEDGDWVIENELVDAGTNYIIVQGDVTNYTTVNGGSAIFVVEALGAQVGTAGNDTLVGTPLKDTISGLGGDDVISGGSGADSLMGNEGNDSILGGEGADTILGGDGNDTLLGEAGADSIVGGDGDDSIVGGADNDTLLGGVGNDTILGGNGNNSIVGGADADSLVAGTGSDTLLGESGNDTLVANATGTASLDGGDGDDSFLFVSGVQLANNTVVGGTGTDTLAFTAAATVTDAQFANVSGVEVVQASSLAGNSIVLGVNAQAGVPSDVALSLFGGASSDLLSAAGMNSGNIWIQGDVVGGTSTVGDTLAAGIGTSLATLVGNNVAGAENYYRITTASLLANNSISGGASSSDILQLTTGFQTLTDGAFAKIAGMDRILLTDRGNSITLGTTAEAAFGGTISILGGANGADTLNFAAVNSDRIYADALAGVNGSVFTAGGNDNTLLGGQAAGANDLFIFNSASALQGASVVGGGGTDTLRLAANAQTIAADTLSGVSGVEVLDIAGAGNRVTLAGALGITTIVGGTGPNTIHAAGYNTNANPLTWIMGASNGSDSLLGGLDGNLFQIKNGANLQNSQITGNTGVDTIQLLAGAQTLGDSAFNNISSIEQLQLGSAAIGNRITLGAIARSKGIATVVGGTGADTIDASAYAVGITIDASASSGARLLGSATSHTNTLIGGSAGGNKFVIGDVGTNSIMGGSNGLDTLAFTNDATIVDGNLSSLSKIGTLEFNAAGNDIVLGLDALVAGIRTLVGGEGSDNGTGNTFNTAAYGTAGVLFQVTDQDYLSNMTTLVGGEGIDTLKFSRDGVSVTDENVDNLHGIEVLRTANGNNRFLFADTFVNAGFETIIGGTGRDTIDMSSSVLYTPAGDDDVITVDLSAGAGYTLVGTTDNFEYAKIIGGNTPGAVILDGGVLEDVDFARMYQGNIGSVFMRTASDNTVTLGATAQGTGLDTLTMSDGNDTIDVTAFAGALTVASGLGDDLLLTSFGALANLVFIGGGGNDTLQIVSSQARSITSLNGTFEALQLQGGNNFVVLGNDAGLSTIYGGSGFDTISMLANTTGINFVMDATKLSTDATAASLVGGSGSDTLTVTDVAGAFADNQFVRVGSVNLAGDIGAIENFVTEANSNASYTFALTAYLAGITTVYSHAGDVLDASGFSDGDPDTEDRALNFVFASANEARTAFITGTAASDTLTLTEDEQIVGDDTFEDKTSIETLVLANRANEITLGANAGAAGIATVIGGTGNDSLTFDSSLQTDLVFIGGGQTTFDTALLSNAAATLVDSYFKDWSSVEKLTTANGDNSITLGTNAVTAGIATITGGTGNDTLNATAYTIAVTLVGGEGDDSLLSGGGNDSISGGTGADWIQGTSAISAGANQIDTLTGGSGADTFVLGDASNAYYNTAAGAGDYVLITDFAAGDQLQLKTLPEDPGNLNSNGYLVGDALYGPIAGSNYYLYRDSNNNGTLEEGDNLIAAITSSVELTTANLKSTHGSFV